MKFSICKPLSLCFSSGTCQPFFPENVNSSAPGMSLNKQLLEIVCLFGLFQLRLICNSVKALCHTSFLHTLYCPLCVCRWWETTPTLRMMPPSVPRGAWQWCWEHTHMKQNGCTSCHSTSWMSPKCVTDWPLDLCRDTQCLPLNSLLCVPLHWDVSFVVSDGLEALAVVQKYYAVSPALTSQPPPYQLYWPSHLLWEKSCWDHLPFV